MYLDDYKNNPGDIRHMCTFMKMREYFTFAREG